MKRLATLIASPVLAAAAFAAVPALAQQVPIYAQESRPPAARVFGQAELDQMLAPVALYPDALLTQLLMAATYPLEVVQAARWSRANPDLQGGEAVRAVENRDWDPSVKSMVAFPQLLARMDERIEWTERLGEAFIGQERQVMDTVQELRRRADSAGNLRSSDEVVVRREAEAIYIEPPSTEYVYVPYYDTRTVYGRWWWPDYQPVLWSPWSGYYYTPGYTAFGWGLGVPVGYGFFYGSFDWPRRYVRYSNHRPWYYNTSRWHGGERWRHDGARSQWRNNRPNYRDGDRRVNTDNRQWRDGDRDGRRREIRDGDRDGRRDGERDGRRDGRPGVRDGRPDNRIVETQRNQETRNPDGRVNPSPAMRAAPVAPAPAYAPARGTPLPPRSAIAQPSAAPAPAYVPQAAAREGAPPQVQQRSAPAPAPAQAERAPQRSAPAQERGNDSPQERAPARGGRER